MTESGSTSGPPGKQKHLSISAPNPATTAPVLCLLLPSCVTMHINSEQAVVDVEDSDDADLAPRAFASLDMLEARLEMLQMHMREVTPWLWHLE